MVRLIPSLVFGASLGLLTALAIQWPGDGGRTVTWNPSGPVASPAEPSFKTRGNSRGENTDGPKGVMFRIVAAQIASGDLSAARDTITSIPDEAVRAYVLVKLLDDSSVMSAPARSADARDDEDPRRALVRMSKEIARTSLPTPALKAEVLASAGEAELNMGMTSEANETLAAARSAGLQAIESQIAPPAEEAGRSWLRARFTSGFTWLCTLIGGMMSVYIHATVRERVRQRSAQAG
jgi:hypothetical protein